MELPDKIVVLHDALAAAGYPHAFGGALALAWCTGRARGTIDIDINIFVETTKSDEVFDALPPGIDQSSQQRDIAKRDSQVRLLWHQTPIDIFLNTLPLHKLAATRIRWESFMGRQIPFLACVDLAIFKSFFNRTKDWADLEEMGAAGTLNTNEVISVLIDHLGVDDERIPKLQALCSLRKE